MSIKSAVEQLKEKDIYSLMLFALYKLNDLPEYSSLSQLAYILDKDALLKLCEFYGGLTITIPTINQLQNMLDGLLMFQLIDVDGENEEKVCEQFDKNVKEIYQTMKKLLKDYKFNSGRENEF